MYKYYISNIWLRLKLQFCWYSILQPFFCSSGPLSPTKFALGHCSRGWNALSITRFCFTFSARHDISTNISVRIRRFIWMQAGGRQHLKHTCASYAWLRDSLCCVHIPITTRTQKQNKYENRERTRDHARLLLLTRVEDWGAEVGGKYTGIHHIQAEGMCRCVCKTWKGGLGGDLRGGAGLICLLRVCVVCFTCVGKNVHLQYRYRKIACCLCLET